MDTILVTGALGQIGSELVPTLRTRYEDVEVVASDIEPDPDVPGPYEAVDVTDRAQVEAVIEKYDVDTVFHLAALLSAAGEQNPDRAFNVNVGGLHNVLEVGREYELDRIVIPSSIAVYGPATPDNPSERTIRSPTTMYGITKVLAENLGAYYHEKYDLDVRGIRLPGIVSHKTRPNGGTTDYAVDAFYEAVWEGEYTYFVREDTRLPMVYMSDAIDALIALAEADESDLQYQCEYNISALSFTAKELSERIEERINEFDARYDPDERQSIADSWPSTLDDTAARSDWGWSAEYDLDKMVDEMVHNLRQRTEGALS
ncbi:NAD-dependent epimerase/dehydratase family protein [Halobellus marinus]|jgi:nucleoside-diphosphate-sugar epimerase|uniref:NAD-dependent epimerase/dehydratase family protein n=1 Tax=Halobellus TaxID=1073986 RepID=UPI0028A7A2FD|nr:NAD-dependent epimerase/dehydratase family protein [Halobellus sp. DFY28]